MKFITILNATKKLLTNLFFFFVTVLQGETFTSRAIILLVYVLFIGHNNTKEYKYSKELTYTTKEGV